MEEQTMERLRNSMEELIKFTLDSHLNETLEIYLGLSKDFCSRLLQPPPPDDPLPLPSGVGGSLEGVPEYPLVERLASALYLSIVSGKLIETYQKMEFFKCDSPQLKQNDMGWDELIETQGSQIVNVFRTVSGEVHVPERLFPLLRDGATRVVVVRRCVCLLHRIKQGVLLLVNKSLVLQVEDVHRYASSEEMPEAESLIKVLPGIRFIEEGVQMHLDSCLEEEEMPSGILAIYILKLIAQPYLSMARILTGLGYEGVQCLLGLAHTIGTIPDALPPPRSVLFSSFNLPYKPNIKGASLTCGARALAKHAERSSNRYWEVPSGNDSAKNKFAMGIISRLISSSCWSNVHIVPQHGAVFEIRVTDGYGARWSKDGSKFIGFLEPYMEDGHVKAWKH